ncbi:carbohydrate porin [Ferrimonas sp.]|uniref:carbohydrate porin n=1 Tax=Ferrimonas sp. TaxID=2080861 RepID=UPI003A93AB5B
MKTKLAIVIGMIFSAAAAAQTSEIEELKQRIDELEKRQQAVEQEKDEGGITLGGAARFQYSYEDYSDDNSDRGGDFDFDVFRLDANGKIGDLTLSAQYRWYQYMDVLHHAWVGYDFSDTQSGQIGVTQVPFGILPYASHSFFFSSNFYTGLEDDYDMGLNYKFESKRNRLDVAFYKNDEQGGIDGYVSERSDRYSYDVLGVRLEGEGTYDAPSLEVGETNTFNLRYAHTLELDGGSVELGLSGQFGELEVDGGMDGDHWAAAVHGVINYGAWNLQLQASDYEYDIDGMDVEQMVVGAYAFYDSIPAEAITYTANIAYSLPVKMGPVTNLTFYNDYSLMTDKPGELDDTFMNVTGMAISAGALYTYVDFVVAENQPFIGGTLVGSGDTNKRVNINFGYYF